MLVKKISFPNPNELEDIEDIENDNIDVFVELEDGYVCTVVVSTPKNLKSLMNKNKMDFLKPGCPYIIVKKLTKEIIEEMIKVYAEEDNGYWLKLYQFSGDIDMSIFNKLQAEHEEYLKELDELDNS